MKNFCLLIISFCLLTAFAFSSKAQDADIAKLKPFLLDEFGRLSSEEMEARGDSWGHELQGDPSSNLLMIIYAGRETPLGSAYRFGATFKAYLTKARGIAPERVNILHGESESPSHRSQVYLIPPGVQIPAVNKTRANIAQTTQFDQYSFSSPGDMDTCCLVDSFDEERAQASLTEFAGYLQENKSLTGYLIAYSQYCTKCSFREIYDKKGIHLDSRLVSLLDAPKIATELLNSQKARLINNFNIEPSRILTINGGFRDFRTVELYLVPANGQKPKAQPKTFPPKRKQISKKKARSK